MGLKWRFFHTSRTIKCWKNPSSPIINILPNLIANEYLVKILASQVYDLAIESPLTRAINLSSFVNNHVYLKREDLQPVFSFKLRGAYNKISKLTHDQLKKGVITCSAGNHAQGVALSASKLGIHAIIVMPEATPKIKVEAVRNFRGNAVQIVLHGKNYDGAAEEANRLAIEKGYTMVHPFDDPEVIAGQGTIGMEIMKTLNAKPLDIVFVCVGGGGLLAGVAAYIKAVKPSVKVIGVEAEDAAGMTSSLIAGKVVTLPTVGLFADGAAVRTVGKETFRICHSLVDEMVTVNNDQICNAIKLCFNDTRSVLEPAGALAIAGMVKYAQTTGLTGQTFVAITSGANMDFDRLRFVSERADSSEVLMAVNIPERPGSFRELHSLIHPRNVTEFSYRHNGTTSANVIVSFQGLIGKKIENEKEELKETLEKNGFHVTDLSENEMAKAHVRHLAGGRSSNNLETSSTTTFEMKELIYRFEFPESPGALDKFLNTLQQFNQGWSISLFHYRNHGHDYGRVLVGLLVQQNELQSFSEFLNKLGYLYHNETMNPAYSQFLK